MIGKTLAHYRVVEKIGEGGMGEVWRATDTRLGRDVALKVLPPAFAGNAERMARFEREARVLAQLNHPGIASIFGIEQADGVRFLAMELADGEDLAQRLARGRFAVADALDVARQIAEALEEAHAQGIVHRDLKPANLKVSPQGRIKILDFGLAKALTDDPTDSAVLDNSPTVTPDVTRAGLILGTAAYMSPEQARGRVTDARADVWAFGCVLYEMLTGVAPFGGASISDVIAAVLTREPDWSALPGDTPSAVRTLLRRCLRKDASQRIHSIADARIELTEVSNEEDEAPVARPPRRWVVPAAAVGAFLLGALVHSLATRESPLPTTDGRLTRLALQVADAPAAPLAQSSSVAISPDGRFVVWVASALADGRDPRSGEELATGSTRLFLRRLGAEEIVSIEGTLGATDPFISPDGRWIGFLDAPTGKLKKVAPDGGAPIELCDAIIRGASWSDDGRIFFSEPTGGIFEISEDGGSPRRISSPDHGANEKTHRFPHALPGSKGLLFTRGSAEILTYDDADVALLSLETGEIRVLLEGGTYPRWVPTGHIVFARAGDLVAVPFDLAELEVKGPPFRVLEGLITSGGWGSAQYAFSRNGTLVYLRGGPDHYHFEPLTLHPDGRTEPVPIAPQPFGEVGVSPDGRTLALSVLGANASLWIHDLDRRTTTRLIDTWDNYAPVWHPSGDSLAFCSNRGGREGVWLTAADGTGNPERLLEEESIYFEVSWSPDGKHLAYARVAADGGVDICTLTRPGGQTGAVIAGPSQEFFAKFSPDGRHLAHVSDETGRSEVYVQPFPPTGRKWRLSEHGGTDPCWSPDGRKVYFWHGHRLMVVPVEPDPTFVPGRARVLVDTKISDIQSYDIFPDGERFLVIGRRADADVEPPMVGRRTRRVYPRASDIQVVVNWFREFRD